MWRIVPCATALTLVMSLAHAGQPAPRASIDLRVRIPAVARLAAQHPAYVDITEDDLRRGELVRQASIDVTTNVPAPLLEVAIADDAFAGVELEGLPRLLPRGRARYQVTCRMRLASDASPGRRPWPLRLSLQAP